jgi:hypothetical protein
MNTPNGPPTDLPNTTVIPAGTLQPGDNLHLHAQGELHGVPAVADPPAAPTKLRINRRVALIMAVLLLLMAGAVTALVVSSQPSTFTVTGTFAITAPAGTYNPATYCTGAGYADVHTGTEVVLSDEAGKTLAVGQLVADASLGDASRRGCAYTFTLTGVPAGIKIYGLTMSHRGTVHYTEAQLRAGPHLTLGG